PKSTPIIISFTQLSPAIIHLLLYSSSFFFNDTSTTEIYTLSLHDALPISPEESPGNRAPGRNVARRCRASRAPRARPPRGSSSRSEEHTSELQSRFDLVCRLLLEKKKKKK